MIKKRTGFTLIEMIIVLAIMVIILGIVTGIFMNGHRIFNQSDVKTTLQSEGQAVQEIISNICMEGSRIEAVEALDLNSNKIRYLKIKSYYKNGNTAGIYNIHLENSNIKINGDTYSNKIESIQINQDIVEEARKVSDSPNYERFSSIDFKIVLTDKKGFSGQVDYPINFTVAFRNKGR